MTVLLFARKYFVDYARSPLNVVLLVVVPLVFVTIAAGAIAQFAEILGSEAAAPALEATTAGWAAGFLAAIAAYFQVSGSRAADRRLAEAGAGSLRVAAARMIAALGLALLASASAVLALALGPGIADLPRTIGTTLMFAVIYLGIGAAIGALVRDQVNGAVVVLFIWLLDVFLGPTMGGSEVFITRLFPTHFVSLVMVEITSGHATPLSDLGWALTWTFGSLLAAGLIFASTTGSPRPTRLVRRGTASDRFAAAVRYGFREQRRNVVLWILLAVVPIIFISLAIAVTPEGPAPVELTEAGRTTTETLSMPDVHGAIMAPITVAFLTGLAGVFIVLGSAEGDRRIALAGLRGSELVSARMVIVVCVALFIAAVSVGVTALDFTPQSWAAFVGANLLVALTYGMLGALFGPVVGRIGGLFLLFLFPFIDLGIGQDAMLDPAPPGWAQLMPGYGAMRVLIDGAFTPGFDALGPLLIALGWLIALAAAALAVFLHVAEPERA